MADAELLELRSARALRGGYEILSELSFTLPAGKTAVIMGAAGSGKSSLLKLAAGLLPGKEGTVFHRGVDLARMTRAQELAFRRSMGFVFQDGALWANQSLFDNLALPVRIHEPRATKAEVEAKVLKAAALVGYRDNLAARPAELSTGERRLVGLARALVLEPELLFLDEPAAFLDQDAAELVLGIIDRLGDEGRGILIVSGNAELAFRSADLVGALGQGKLLAWGSYEEATRWTDPGLRGVIGRLRPRPPGRERGGLLGDWERAMLGDADAGAAKDTSGEKR